MTDEQSVTGMDRLDDHDQELGHNRNSRGRGRLPPAERRRALVRKRRTYTFLMWVLALLALFFAWATFGMMMRIGFLPVFDLGYSWFDSHILYFFGVAAR
ncbi:hypothetical protein H3S87_05975 [Bifidobacterium sp. W8108]|uniref:hypothetical protein n=1 Tax=unclassified Bifidobacterium TaxID=2608897 RepID=UPI0018DAFCB9|nr:MULTISPECIES: hypothetical protein [unclassified Bifidobacterium]MBH9979200.1 hypothetical protein [Bifidobacterium sp. W8108]MBI0172928.1 hypothetical protein [Bifidobacterium sp. M0307]